MGIFYAGIPPWLVDWCKAERFSLAVETGTYRGDSAALLARELGECITIELDEALASAAATRFAEVGSVTVRQGDSGVVLEEIVTSVDRPALFWLDGHWSGGATASDNPCPLGAELDAICKSPIASASVVAIDDARLLGFPHALDPNMESWPKLADVLQQMEAAGLGTFLVDDVVVGVPRELVASFQALHTRSDIRQSSALLTTLLWRDRLANPASVLASVRERLTRKGR